jgi:serine/threonine protein kinase
MGESIGKFTVMGTLGHGAHSTILQIRREKDARIYALKVVAIDDAEEMKFYEQAKHEYEVAQKLDHPNLVKIPAIEIERSWLFQVKKVRLLIEYVDGRTLDRCPAMSVSKLLSIFSQTAALG